MFQLVQANMLRLARFGRLKAGCSQDSPTHESTNLQHLNACPRTAPKPARSKTLYWLDRMWGRMASGGRLVIGLCKFSFPSVSGSAMLTGVIACSTMVAFGLIAAALLASAAAPNISIELTAGAFKVTGWTAPATPPSQGWPSILVVYAGTGDVPPLLGAYAVEAGALVFH